MITGIFTVLKQYRHPFSFEMGVHKSIYNSVLRRIYCPKNMQVCDILKWINNVSLMPFISIYLSHAKVVSSKFSTYIGTLLIFPFELFGIIFCNTIFNGYLDIERRYGLCTCDAMHIVTWNTPFNDESGVDENQKRRLWVWVMIMRFKTACGI